MGTPGGQMHKFCAKNYPKYWYNENISQFTPFDISK